MSRTCNECKFCYKQDTGYSNYTVLETEISCLKKLNPGLPKDEEYRPAGGDPVLAFAIQCSGYVEGEPLYIDCEQENVPYPNDKSEASFYTEDTDVIAAFDAYNA